MNSTELNIYNALLHLTKESDSFFFQDYVSKGNTYRVFNYRIASYTEFQQPYATEARGITFLMKEGIPSCIVSRPYTKFFNLGENPSTIGLDLSTATGYAEKADGSLIVTYYDPETKVFGLKSKQAFHSEQALMAEEVLETEKYQALKKEIMELVESEFTVLMELCSPANRIVLEYEDTVLRVHGIRHNIEGYYINKYSLVDYPNLIKHWVDYTKVNGLPDDFVETTLKTTGIEGFVVEGPWGRFKIKTEWYCNLHHLKDSISTAKRLIEAILYERVDDVRALFKTDIFTLNRISEMENKIVPVYNGIIHKVENFYKSNKDLDRKSYAIKGQQELGQSFSMCMNLYLGKKVDYQAYCMKYAKELFKLTDEEEVSNIGE